MNILLIIILFALLIEFLIFNLSRYLDVKNFSISCPAEFTQYYDSHKYTLSRNYLIDNTKLSYVNTFFDFFIVLLIIFNGYFNIIDVLLRSLQLPIIITGILFFIIIFIIYDIISIPFALYKTFVIEEKYGFNKISFGVYFLDKIKSYVILLILGCPIMYSVLFFFETYQTLAWFYASICIGVFMLLIQPIFTLFIAPFFNNFSELKDDSLKNQIHLLANKINFPISNIHVMDGSRRSSKANAYFSGIGKNKRIALFDTLIEQHTKEEIVSIVAHEMGHYKLKHNIYNTCLSVIHMTIMFFVFSFFLNNYYLFDAFGMKNYSVYASLVFFSILYSPIDMLFSIAFNAYSRKCEYEADAFALRAIGTAKHLIAGLKKLTVNNLSIITPHSLTVYLTYSHPPINRRIKALVHNE